MVTAVCSVSCSPYSASWTILFQYNGSNSTRWSNVFGDGCLRDAAVVPPVALPSVRVTVLPAIALLPSVRANPRLGRGVLSVLSLPLSLRSRLPVARFPSVVVTSRSGDGISRPTTTRRRRCRCTVVRTVRPSGSIVFANLRGRTADRIPNSPVFPRRLPFQYSREIITPRFRNEIFPTVDQTWNLRFTVATTVVAVYY